MEAEEDDDDIWDVKSLKRRHISTNSQENACKNTKSKRNYGYGRDTSTKKSTTSKVKLPKKRKTEIKTTPKKFGSNKSIQDFMGKRDAVSMAGQYCPKCQVPQAGLLTQTLASHVTECLESTDYPSVPCTEGLNCNASSPSHFKEYNHHLLALSRSSSPTRPQADTSATCSMASSDDCTDSIMENDEDDSGLANHTSSNASNNIHRDSSNVNSNVNNLESSIDSCISINISADNSERRYVCASDKTSDITKSGTTASSKCTDTKASDDESAHLTSSNVRSQKVIQSPSLQNDIIPKPEKNSVGKSLSSGSDDQDWFDEVDDDSFQEILLKDNVLTKSKSRGSDTDTSCHTKADSCKSPSEPKSQENHNEESNSTQVPIMKSSVAKKVVDGSQTRTKQKDIGAFFSPKAKQKPPSQCNEQKPLKQQDIGVFFGLKPKASGDSGGVNTTQKDVQQRGTKGAYKLRAQGKQVNYSDGADSLVDEKPRTGARSKCPFYKKIPDTPFVVDAFRYGSIPGIKVYFLSHFHYDHYGGLTKRFAHPLYCSKITANLVQSKIKVDQRYITSLPMDTPVVVDKVQVTLLDANHCPGAVLFLFELPNGQTILHTGDFRASPSMEHYPALINKHIHTLYLDTTYCDPQYTFPAQEETVDFAVRKAVQAVQTNPKTLIVCGTYTIGKEKVFLAIAKELQCRVTVQSDKKRVLECLESESIKSMITTDKSFGRVHVLPMGHLNHKQLSSYLEQFKGRFTELVAFKPTGWEHKSAPLSATRPSKRGAVSIYGVPYSEHSSYEEMKRFVQFIRPDKIIPTVNIHSADRRDEMTAIFKSWLNRKY